MFWTSISISNKASPENVPAESARFARVEHVLYVSEKRRQSSAEDKTGVDHVPGQYIIPWLNARVFPIAELQSAPLSLAGIPFHHIFL